jgi:hypothetical protein
MNFLVGVEHQFYFNFVLIEIIQNFIMATLEASLFHRNIV